MASVYYLYDDALNTEEEIVKKYKHGFTETMVMMRKDCILPQLKFKAHIGGTPSENTSKN
ncbi:hypothetical protein NQ317_000828 [Molorchus minor]|uniref:Uncharacterized protein n=1 Tax=Molorchus minor TaxID=1323400 RepID=A0ABQ9J8W8_9CUCU|nr:hypothetical protein NQ317_000828 [Molorchus minor]